ncbi:MAG: EF-P lysine aminoacylase EpmA [Methylococcales bacterium]|nr:EF-P lysine aminoacylase EpmA [Methylococcales bacterium]
MFPEPDWRPTCAGQALFDRARLLTSVRAFFAERAVLEVETPVLSRYRGTDPNLNAFRTQVDSRGHSWYLQTSPEFAMKRLLANGVASIYQIAKAFRQDEQGRHHNPEFTLLEWYRTEFDLERLMTETEQLLRAVDVDQVLPTKIERFRYRDLMLERLALDPWQFDVDVYRACAKRLGFDDAPRICGDAHSVWLDFLFSQAIQPQLGRAALTWVYQFPVLQSSLARVSPNDPNAVERAELFIDGMELANGYHELIDARQQQQRFEQENQWRIEHGRVAVEADPRLLAALRSGLPDCAGIALGLDRLLMLLTGAGAIDEVLAFSSARA